MIVTVDTNILIWCLRSVCTDDRASDILPRCAEFLDWLDRFGNKLALTATCVSEFIDGSDETQRVVELRFLQSRYKILPFDTKAAVIAADIRGDKTFISQMKGQYGKTQACINSDIHIVATALAHGVQRIYSDDKGVRAAAKRGGLEAKNIPTLEEMKPTAEPKSREDRVLPLFQNEEE